MKLIIAEKPSQAKEYAKALGNFSTKNGYLENSEYYITWCFGHLVELERDSKYREEGKWNKSYLPLIPSKFLYKIGSDQKGNIDSGKKAQLKIISDLMKKSSEIINGTDADREGELIFLYVYNFLECKLPFKRLWISTLTENDIKKGFKNLLNPNEVKNLGKSAYARAIADWLVGVNGTQASTLQFGQGTLLTIGRVQTVILKIICERFLKNKNFQKSYSYKLVAEHSKNVNFFSESEVYQTKQEIELIKQKLSDHHVCKKVEDKQQKKGCPLLFSIDTLIIEANRKFGYSGQDTLSIAQSLYEKKLTSYPRTDSEYINEENFDNLKTYLVELCKTTLNLNFSFSNKKPRSVNDKKMTGSHDAIVPTGNDPEGLSEKEANIFKLILIRCLQSFSEDAVYFKRKITFENQNEIFYSYLSKLIHKGWLEYDIKSINENESHIEKGEEIEQNFNIEIAEGEKVKVLNLGVKEIESKPPLLYSDVNLTQDLTNFGKLLKEENSNQLSFISENIDINQLQIGTQATRPGIVERLKNLGFITLTKNKYVPTEKGLKYYEVIKNLEVSNAIVTAIWEMKLKKVAEGTEDISSFYKEITTFTDKIVHDIFAKTSDISFKVEPVFIGACPKCKKGQIKENKKAFQCSEWKSGCDFSIWKIISERKISEGMVKDLLTKGITKNIDKFKSKTGKTFSGKLELDKQTFKISFNFK